MKSRGICVRDRGGTPQRSEEFEPKARPEAP